jgi:hypothetical protein
MFDLVVKPVVLFAKPDHHGCWFATTSNEDFLLLSLSDDGTFP